MQRSQKKNVIILVPSYRCENTIVDTLKSIVEQGDALNRVHSVVIAEDASGDRTPEVARAFWKHPTPLVILDPKVNRGEYVNVNEAVATFPPSVEWFLILHGDNIANPGWLDTLLSRIELADPRLATMASSWNSFFEDGRVDPGENLGVDKSWQIHGSRETVRDTLFSGCWWHISACAIRISAFKSVGGLPKGYYHKGDWDFLMRLMEGGWKMEYVPVPLLGYRDNALGSSARSYASMNDIHEAHSFMLKHTWSLSTREIIRYHFKLVGSVMKRMVKLLIQRRFKTQLRAATLLAGLLKTLAMLLVAKTFGGASADAGDPRPELRNPYWKGYLDWVRGIKATEAQLPKSALEEVIRALNPTRIVETGTSYGGSTVALSEMFEGPVYSVDIDASKYAYSRQRTQSLKNVHLHCEDSTDFLRKLLMEGPPQRTLFVLRTHREKQSPVWSELSLIRSYCKEWVVLVDGEGAVKRPEDFLRGEYLSWLTQQVPTYASKMGQHLWLSDSPSVVQKLEKMSSLKPLGNASNHTPNLREEPKLAFG